MVKTFPKAGFFYLLGVGTVTFSPRLRFSGQTRFRGFFPISTFGSGSSSPGMASSCSSLHLWCCLLRSLLMLLPPKAMQFFGTHWLAGPWLDDCLAFPRFANISFGGDYPIGSAAQVWGHLWTGNTVRFTSDNQATSEIFNKVGPVHYSL